MISFNRDSIFWWLGATFPGVGAVVRFCPAGLSSVANVFIARRR